jgi:hypothetical protein
MAASRPACSRDDSRKPKHKQQNYKKHHVPPRAERSAQPLPRAFRLVSVTPSSMGLHSSQLRSF